MFRLGLGLGLTARKFKNSGFANFVRLMCSSSFLKCSDVYISCGKYSNLGTFLGIMMDPILGITISPHNTTETTPGEGCDFNLGAGPCFGLLAVGETLLGTTYGAFFEESTDNSTWTVIPGAVIPNATASDAGSSIIFNRTKRWVRGTIVLSGADPFATTSITIGQKKA